VSSTGKQYLFDGLQPHLRVLNEKGLAVMLDGTKLPIIQYGSYGIM